ncbi:hypothetical protein PIB30_055947 [Stylosanthes scabra]|uniref:Uncharacterized protein n=1 Tax=Stylosanthes scabra TaxID=79078 RepID=A0ABU6YHF2_9FABA|nr:hypothetical protein [Stylosanthes scabra]
MVQVRLIPRPGTITCQPIRACSSARQSCTPVPTVSSLYSLPALLARYLQVGWSEILVTPYASVPVLLTPPRSRCAAPLFSTSTAASLLSPAADASPFPSHQHIATNVAQTEPPTQHPPPASAPRSFIQTGPILDLWYGRTLTAAA